MGLGASRAMNQDSSDEDSYEDSQWDGELPPPSSTRIGDVASSPEDPSPKGAYGPEEGAEKALDVLNIEESEFGQTPKMAPWSSRLARAVKEESPDPNGGQTPGSGTPVVGGTNARATLVGATLLAQMTSPQVDMEQSAVPLNGRALRTGADAAWSRPGWADPRGPRTGLRRVS